MKTRLSNYVDTMQYDNYPADYSLKQYGELAEGGYVLSYKAGSSWFINPQDKLTAEFEPEAME
jgi:hypothetical protein